MHMAAIAVDSMPTATPTMMLVPWPEVDAAAIRRTCDGGEVTASSYRRELGRTDGAAVYAPASRAHRLVLVVRVVLRDLKEEDRIAQPDESARGELPPRVGVCIRVQ